jgi:catechol 2,3-dioxygenase-like lactoylglutathione lyase family enzyme
MFSRLDTVILRVRDLAAAQQWYATTLGLHAVYEDAAQGLAVLGLDGGASLTLWAVPAGQTVGPSSTFPIFGVADARAAHAHLAARGVAAGPLTDGPGVRYFRFTDPDGNPLEACEVLSAAAAPAEAEATATAG